MENHDAMGSRLADLYEILHDHSRTTIPLLQKCAFLLQQTTTPLDPNYMTHKFLPRTLYQEYLTVDGLQSERLIFPPSWVHYFENELPNPYRPNRPQVECGENRVAHPAALPSCCFVCADGTTAGLVRELLIQKAHREQVNFFEWQTENLNPGDLVGMVTKADTGDICVIRNDSGLIASEVMEYLEAIVRDYCLDIVIEPGPNVRSVKLQLPKFCLYYITTNRTKQTNQVAGIFPRQVVVADLLPVQKAAIIGQVAAKHGIPLSYLQARQLLTVATEDALAPEIVADLLCREHHAQLKAFAGGTTTAAELAKFILNPCRVL